MLLRCKVDGLLVDAEFTANGEDIVVYDGDESFVLEALEAVYYEIVSANDRESILLLRSRYRILRRAADFRKQVRRNAAMTGEARCFLFS